MMTRAAMALLAYFLSDSRRTVTALIDEGAMERLCASYENVSQQDEQVGQRWA